MYFLPITYHVLFAAVFAALILPLYSFAAGPDDDFSFPIPSSSAAEPLPHDPEHPPSAARYVQLLSPGRISSLTARTELHPLDHSDPTLPFFRGHPIFTVKTPPHVIEQALKDYRLAIILDPARKQSRRLVYGNGRIAQQLVPDPGAVLLLNGLGENVHVIKKFVEGFRVAGVPDEGTDVRELPHMDGVPILREVDGTDSLGHMRRAARSGKQVFWHIRRGRSPVMIDLSKDVYARLAKDREQTAVVSKISTLVRDRSKYGESLASILHGAPLYPRSDWRDSRIRGPTLASYKRYLPTEDRYEMIRALQADGKFRLYMPEDDGRTFKVRLKNPNAERGERLMVEVKELTALEKAQERAAALLGKVKLPVVRGA